jgi:hypothetical protein
MGYYLPTFLERATTQIEGEHRIVRNGGERMATKLRGDGGLRRGAGFAFSALFAVVGIFTAGTDSLSFT